MSSFRSPGLARILHRAITEPTVEPEEPYPPVRSVAERKSRASFYGQVYNPLNFKPATKR